VPDAICFNASGQQTENSTDDMVGMCTASDDAVGMCEEDPMYTNETVNESITMEDHSTVFGIQSASNSQHMKLILY